MRIDRHAQSCNSSHPKTSQVRIALHQLCIPDMQPSLPQPLILKRMRRLSTMHMMHRSLKHHLRLKEEGHAPTGSLGGP